MMRFTKMQGSGNDFIVIEDFNNEILDINALAKKLCDRHFGIGADGILVVRKSEIADTQMIIINADGSYASMCGNGIRCFAKYVWEKGIAQEKEIKIETGDGVKIAYLTIEDNEVKQVTINMGHFSFEPKAIPLSIEEEIVDKEVVINNKDYNISTVLMGVPHTVLYGEINSFDVQEGKFIEKHNLFPQGTNVNFSQVIDRQNIKVKTWERGAGPTLACGTGCCAAVVVGNKLGLIDNKVKVEVPGGALQIEITNSGVLMTGPAVITFEGESKI